MRITTNEKLIKQRSTIARYTTFGGLGLLLASLVTSFTSDYIGLAYAALLIGFICAIIGSTLANRWIKLPRAEQVLEKSLKGLDNRNHLYNYFPPTPHIMIMPTGLLVFKTKIVDGTVTCRNGKWGRPWKWTRLIGGMGQEPLGDPIAELQLDLSKLREWLSAKIEDAALIPIDGYVVFTDPRTVVTVDDKDLPVVPPDELKDTLRKSKRGPVLAQTLLDNLERILNEQADAKTTK
jgi:hypothetical protein